MNEAYVISSENKLDDVMNGSPVYFEIGQKINHKIWRLEVEDVLAPIFNDWCKEHYILMEPDDRLSILNNQH